MSVEPVEVQTSFNVEHQHTAQMKLQVKHEAERQRFSANLAGEAFHFMCSDNRGFKVDGKLLAYLGMTFATMWGSFGDQKEPMLLDNMVSSMFEMRLALAKVHQKEVATLPPWPTEQEIEQAKAKKDKTVVNLKMETLTSQYEKALAVCLQKMEPVRKQQYDAYMTKLRGELEALSDAEFANVLISEEKDNLKAHIAQTSKNIRAEIDASPEHKNLSKVDRTALANKHIHEATIKMRKEFDAKVPALRNMVTQNRPQQLHAHLLQVWRNLTCALIASSNYYDATLQMYLFCSYFNRKIICKTPEQIRQDLGIVNDFSEEETRRNKNENTMYEGMT